MRIVTWNVNSVRVRLDRILAWIDRLQPEVLCLQELKCQDAQMPRERFEERGYHVAAFGQKTYNGVALISREPLENVVTGIPLAGDDQARGITAQVFGIRIVNLYVPNGQDVDKPAYAYKLAWLDALSGWLAANCRPEDPLVVCGDFNIAPEDRDVHDPEKWREQVLCTTAERARFQALLGFGLVDSFRAFEQAAGHFTWWDYRNFAFRRKWGLRIDHHLVSAPVLRRARAVEIDVAERKAEGASDHAPVSLLLD